jgi:hypothetical protein
MCCRQKVSSCATIEKLALSSSHYVGNNVGHFVDADIPHGTVLVGRTNEQRHAKVGGR